MSLAFDDSGLKNETLLEWYKEVNVLENKCELDINLVIDMVNTDMDDIIPLADGIIYFLNPTSKEDSEFFEIVLPIIQSSKRGIPVVLVYLDPSGILPIAVNDLLEELWINHPDLEGFVNLSHRDFHQVLQCICEAIITGDTPLNIENAWMRYPIFIQLANIYFKNGFIEQAARSIRKAAMIADIFNKQNYYIIAEKAALLFSEASLFLEASNVMLNIDKTKVINFKMLYADSLLSEAVQLFNRKEFEKAARKYLEAAQWSAIELPKAQSVKEEAFRMAIISWISATKFNNAFQIFESLDHDFSRRILMELPEIIEISLKFLVDNQYYQDARDQLYRTITLYQKEGLFDILEKFTSYLEKILIKLLDKQILNRERFAAKQTYDEIENLWGAYNVERTDIDSQLELLIQLFLENYDFAMTSLLMNKVNSKVVKKKLTERISKTEDQYKEAKKKDEKQNIQLGLDALNIFIDAENQIIVDLSQEAIEKSRVLVANNEYKEAANNLKELADYFREIGKERAQDDILTEAVSILLEDSEMHMFFEYYDEMSIESQLSLLKNKFESIKRKLNELIDKTDFSYTKEAYDKMIIIFRDHMLYDQAVEISELFIEFIKATALSTIKKQSDKQGIIKVKNLEKDIELISSMYLDDKIFDLDEIYVELIHIFLENGDFSAAHEYCDKILNKELKKKVHEQIDRKETEKSQLELDQLEKGREKEELQQRVVIIGKKAQEASIEKKDLLRQRNALKRIYFTDALENLKNKDLDRANVEYKNSVRRFISSERYNMAGISLIMIIIIYLSQKKTKEAADFLEKTKEDLSGLEKLIKELFPFSLAEYLFNVNRKLGEEQYLKALKFVKVMALFEEEIDFLNNIYGDIFPSEEKIAPVEKVNFDIIKEDIEFLSTKIKMEKQEISKRKLMKNEYWKLALDDLHHLRYKMASDSYFSGILKLAEKKFIKQALISLIIGSFIYLKIKAIKDVKVNFLNNLNKISKFEKDVEDFPEIKFMDLLFTCFEYENQELIKYGVNILKDNLFFFEPEVKFLEDFLSKEQDNEAESESVSRKRVGELQKRDIKLEQEFASLRQKMSDLRTDSPSLLAKRKAMRRRYYQETIDLLNSKNYQSLAKNYMSLAKWSLERKDFASSSLHLLLYGLASLKFKDEIIDIQVNVNKFLNALGLNKRLIEDTFPVKLVLFLIELDINDIEKYDSRISEMLVLLPLFEEEKVLINYKEN